MSVSVPPGWRDELRTGLLACHYCIAAATSFDHIVPVSLGGASYPGHPGSRNLQPACQECNGAKAGSLPTCCCRRCQRALTWWQQHLPEDHRRQLVDVLAGQVDVLSAVLVAPRLVRSDAHPVTEVWSPEGGTRPVPTF